MRRMSRSTISALIVFALLSSGYVIQSAADVEPDVIDDTEGDVTIESESTEDDDSVFEDAEMEDETLMASDGDDMEQQRPEGIYGLPGVTTSYAFPDNENLKFPIGVESKILIGFHNGAEMPLNLTMVGGFTRTVMDYAYSIQNFTIISTGKNVPINGEVTVAYTFVPRKELRPMDLFLTIHLIYETPPIEDPERPEEGALKRQFFHAVFNSTAEVIEAPGLDHELVMLSVTILTMIAGIFFLIFTTLFNGKKGFFRWTKGSKKPVAKDRNPVDDKEEWLKGTDAPNASKKTKSQSAAGNGSSS